jgi:hypothetical protein
MGAGFVSEVRRQRAKGANFKPDETFTPSAVAAKWKEVTDFSSGSEYPVGMEGKNPMVRTYMISNHYYTRSLTFPPLLMFRIFSNNQKP